MTTNSSRIVLGLLFGLQVGGCTPGAHKANVQGDVYLLMQNGDVKRGAGNTVLLLGPADSVMATRQRICHKYGEQLIDVTRRIGLSPADMPVAPVTLLDSAFVRFARASSKTGINAHYRFDGVPTGNYVLWAETMIGDNSYTWWAPITVTGTDSVSKDLDNSTEVHAALYCTSMKDSLAPVLAQIGDSVLHFRDSVANFGPNARRQNWLRCMTKARAALKREDGVVSEDIVDQQRECWKKYPVDPMWAN